jgi:deazaflavin-dependent oxidoreductase (nitroreductase family)
MTEQQPATATDWNQQIIEEFRANGGVVGGMFQGALLVLLTTIGAKSGKPRTSPAGYLRDGDRILVFASNAGLPKTPDWYHNLIARPGVTVEIGTGDGGVETYAATATPIEGEERDRLYKLQSELVPAYGEYQAKSSRTIPVIALHRVDYADRPATGRSARY